MKVELELGRLEEIREVIGSDVPAIVAGMLATMSEAVAQVERSMAQGDLLAAAKAAHSARNDALIVGAKGLLAALTSLEEAAQHGASDAAHKALQALERVWPSTRDELARVANGDKELDSN